MSLNLIVRVAKITNQIGQYTRNKGLANNNGLIKLILQLANNAGEIGFKKNQVFEELKIVFLQAKIRRARCTATMLSLSRKRK